MPPAALAKALPVTSAGRIGPNAIIQTNAELIERVGLVAARTVLRDAGLERVEASPPTGMVAEDDVRRLFVAVERHLPAQAALILHAAGGRTARYLLANRIPRAVQWVLEHLPPWLAARALLGAISRNAWTFAGTGALSTEVAPTRALVRIAGCPVCRGVKASRVRCDFYAGTFDELAQALLGPHGRAHEAGCMAHGAPACTFVLEWNPPAAPDGLGS
jgi:divinyl protochlorophyllide a 8-vinyl-reductase